MRFCGGLSTTCGHFSAPGQFRAAPIEHSACGFGADSSKSFKGFCGSGASGAVISNHMRQGGPELPFRARAAISSRHFRAALQLRSGVSIHIEGLSETEQSSRSNFSSFLSFLCFRQVFESSARQLRSGPQSPNANSKDKYNVCRYISY